MISIDCKFLTETVPGLHVFAVVLAEALGFNDFEKSWLHEHAAVNPQFLFGPIWEHDFRGTLKLALKFAGVVDETANDFVAGLEDADIVQIRKNDAFHRLVAFADERYRIWKEIYSFFSEDHKFTLGVYRGITIYKLFRINGRLPVEEESSDKVDQLVELSKLYIDAAFSLAPEFEAKSFNAGYGLNNFSYLRREFYGEEGSREHIPTLYRVFVPFSGNSPEIEKALSVACNRSCIVIAAQDYEVTAEVQKLLDWKNPFEDEDGD